MNKKQIIDFLKSKDDRELFSCAKKVRKSCFGVNVYIRGLIEFSNNCARNCMYCGLRRDNKKIKRYRIPCNTIVDLSCRIAAKGIKTVLLQSGDDFYYTQKMLCGIVKKVKAKFPDVVIALSVGERILDDYKAFYDAGVDRYLLKHETINSKLYHKMHPGQSLKKRLKILEHLRKTGFQIATGHLIGLPGQTTEDIANEILFYQDFLPGMIGMGPFIPQHNTPLAKYQSPELKLILKNLALTRIVNRIANMPVTTALATLGGYKAQVKALSQAGCNVIMVNFTPLVFRQKYEIYDKKVKVGLKMASRVINLAGRKMSFDKGEPLDISNL
ncbi:MAG: [FeFe] hydrogenase H-cluster radical SAM maturase HydE [Candidatus Omnitrophica bacterium]|nr:[FeFe] hydrogenase H-cluster radical SAM maturase HydE [Candidatus Omnitrophota bacterium]MBU4478588.1 [FeFe] hydrogenase H-cluster radical SAM maturase HydE [Candidatus Omnitrophota bacterium]